MSFTFTLHITYECEFVLLYVARFNLLCANWLRSAMLLIFVFCVVGCYLFYSFVCDVAKMLFVFLL